MDRYSCIIIWQVDKDIERRGRTGIRSRLRIVTKDSTHHLGTIKPRRVYLNFFGTYVNSISSEIK